MGAQRGYENKRSCWLAAGWLILAPEKSFARITMLMGKWKIKGKEDRPRMGFPMSLKAHRNRRCSKKLVPGGGGTSKLKKLRSNYVFFEWEMANRSERRPTKNANRNANQGTQ